MERDKTIEQHYRKNFKHLVNIMLKRVPNHSRALAEEVVQEAYAEALKYWNAYDPNRGAFTPWFNRILHGVASKSFRAESGFPSLDDEDTNLEPHILNDEDWIPKEVVVKIQEAIKNESPLKSEVLHMFFNLGMKARDISACMNLSHSNVRQIIYRFRIDWNDENVF